MLVWSCLFWCRLDASMQTLIILYGICLIFTACPSLERLISGFDYDFVERHHIIPLLAFRRALPLLMESSRLSNLPLANASPRPSFDSFLRVLDETDVNHSVIPRGLSALQIDGYCSARIPLCSDVIYSWIHL